MAKIRVLFSKGWGSVLAESFLALGGLEYDREEIDMEGGGPAKDKLYAINPLGQVPTLVLENGEVLTESLAIAHYVQSRAPQAALVPSASSAQHARFLRWSTFMVTAIYPTWTYGDRPETWVLNADAAQSLRDSTDAHRKSLWAIVNDEADAKGPYFLGAESSAIDIYIAVMTNWRPRAEWFNEHAPRLAAIAAKVREWPSLKKVWADNF